MQERELILRILRLNLVAAPRVIAPGPATRFPVTLVCTGGMEVIVGSLREARAIAPAAGPGTSSASAMAPTGADKASADTPFFVERVPVTETRRLRVSGYLVSPRGEESRGSAQLAVQAAYCLGLEEALVDIGLGPGGPWVLNVTGPDEGVTPGFPGGPPVSRPAFLGARAEYLRVDPVTGLPEHAFHTLDLSPSGGGPAFPVRSDDPALTWISSPMPFPDMPLTMRLLFGGDPDLRLVQLLDMSIAILGMLVSPVEEARQRHATAEGLLGAIRSTAGKEGPGFEYLCVPSLLWSPAATQGMVAATSAVAAYPDSVLRADGPWKATLDQRYQVQRAYYHGDKDFFSTVLDDLGRAFASLPLQAREIVRVKRLLEMAEAALGGQPVEGDLRGSRDFRPSWGIAVRETPSRCLSVGQAGIPAEDQSSLQVAAGLRAMTLPAQNVVPRDPLVEGPPPSWTSVSRVHSVRLNPVMSKDMALPGDMTYRAVPGRPVREYVAAPGSRGGEAGDTTTLAIGPVLGIMAPPEDGPRRFGIETDRFKEIVKIAAAQGILAYVFFPDDSPESDSSSGSSGAAGSEDTAQGWLYRERKGWFRSQVPVPDVIYDRHIPDVLPTGAIRDVAREFQGRYPQTQFINSLEMVRACRDKLASHGLLARDPFVAGYLPETIPAEDEASVARFASARRRTYLKLRGGTGSRGLVFIERPETPGTVQGPFNVSIREEDGSATELAARDTAGLAGVLRAVLHPGDGPAWEYIAQHGVDLVKAPGAGEVFEVRVICQKGGAGRWLRTGMVCRFSPERGRFIVPRKELHARVDVLLEQVFPGRVREIKEEIRELARRIPPLLEEGSGRGGEMSVDLGIDTKGKPWLIEVNSKPATLFRDIAAFELRELSLRRVVNYAVSLFENHEAGRSSAVRTILNAGSSPGRP